MNHFVIPNTDSKIQIHFEIYMSRRCLDIYNNRGLMSGNYGLDPWNDSLQTNNATFLCGMVHST